MKFLTTMWSYLYCHHSTHFYKTAIILHHYYHHIYCIVICRLDLKWNLDTRLSRLPFMWKQPINNYFNILFSHRPLRQCFNKCFEKAFQADGARKIRAERRINILTTRRQGMLYILQNATFPSYSSRLQNQINK